MSLYLPGQRLAGGLVTARSLRTCPLTRGATQKVLLISHWDGDRKQLRASRSSEPMGMRWPCGGGSVGRFVVLSCAHEAPLLGLLGHHGFLQSTNTHIYLGVHMASCAKYTHRCKEKTSQLCDRYSRNRETYKYRCSHQ